MLIPFVRPQYFTNTGLVAAGYQLFFYENGTFGSTNTKQNTTDGAGGSTNPNPILLDSAGRPDNAGTPIDIHLTPGLTYTVVMASDADTDPPASPIWQVDNVVGDFSYTNYIGGYTATRVTTSQFKITGLDVSALFSVGMPIKLTGGADRYANVSAVSYSTDTIIDVIAIKDSSSNVATLHASMDAAYYASELLAGIKNTALDTNTKGFHLVNYPLSSSENSTGKTPVNFEYYYDDPRRHGAKADGVTDDTTAINNAAIAIGSGGTLDLKNFTYLLDTGHLILTNGCTVKSDGATIIQSQWGHPAIEIRASNTSLLGKFFFQYNGARTVVISSDTLGYGWGAGNWKDYGSAILINTITYPGITDVQIDTIDVFGFINAVWIAGDRVNIDKVYFDTCDMGVTGGAGVQQTIGTITGTNITISQGVEGHALYVNGTSATNESLVCNVVHVTSSPNGCSLVKSGAVPHFAVGKIMGNGLGGILNCQDNTHMTVDIIDVGLTVAVPSTLGIVYALLSVGSNSQVKINSLHITSNQSNADCPSFLQASTGGTIEVLRCKIDCSTAAASQPRVINATSTAHIIIDNPYWSFPNSACSNAFINAANYVVLIVNKPYIKTDGTPPWILANTYAAGQRYQLIIEPTLIIDGLVEGAITDTANVTFNVIFASRQPTATGITGANPIVTHCNVASITQGVATNVSTIRRGGLGQELILRAGDSNSNLLHNNNPGADGNLILLGAATLTGGSWSVVTFQKIGNDMVQIA